MQKLLRAIIRRKGLTIYKVAKAIGIDHANLYHSLGDDSNPELKTIMKVLDFLGYEIKLIPKKGGGKHERKHSKKG